jgi:hypothetical protein
MQLLNYYNNGINVSNSVAISDIQNNSLTFTNVLNSFTRD